MAKDFIHIRNWSIVTKTVVLVCGLVTILVILGGWLLIKLEVNLIDTFMTTHVEEINRALDARKQGELINLRQFIEFIGQILNQTSAEHVFKHDMAEINELLSSYMQHSVILAIAIIDTEEKSVSALWKQEGFVFQGTVLPEGFIQESSLFVQTDIVFYERTIGTVQIYYSKESLTNKIETLKEAAQKETETFTQESEGQLQRVITSQSAGLGIILVALMLSLWGTLWLLVRKPLLMVTDIAYRLGRFDLTLNIHTTRHDEIGVLLDAISQMVRSFRMLLGQVQQSGILVTSSSTELSATVKQQEAIIATQVESTNKVLHSVREISEATSRLTRTIQQVASTFQETTEFASRGQTDLVHMEDAMQQMENASTAISQKLEAINEKAENITTVVTTITKVADQTNLLSLNAAIEAEKAGEYGRGFTVVATEIRRLADQTAVATLDIEQMVQEMQAAVSAGVMEMEKFIIEVRRSAEDVERISLQLAGIIDQIQALFPNFEAINTAMEHQSEHTESIKTSIVRLSEETRETKDSLQETYAVIEQLRESARNLQSEVSHFKID